MSKYANLFDNVNTTKPSLFPEDKKPSLFGDSTVSPLLQKAIDWKAKTGESITPHRILYSLGNPQTLGINDLYKVGEVHLNTAKSLNELCDKIMLELRDVNERVDRFESCYIKYIRDYAAALSPKKKSWLSMFYSTSQPKFDSRTYCDFMSGFGQGRETVEIHHITPYLDKVKKAVSSANFTIKGLEECHVALQFLKDMVPDTDKDVVNKRIISVFGVLNVAKISLGQLEMIVKGFEDKKTLYFQIESVIIPLINRIEAWKQIPGMDISDKIVELNNVISGVKV